MNGLVKRLEVLEQLQVPGDRCRCGGLHQLQWLRNTAERPCLCACCGYVQALDQFGKDNA